MKKNLARGLMLTLVVGVSTVVIMASSASGIIRPFPCGPRYCLDVWQPVICSNGVVYSNMCYAQRACATGCVPYDPVK